MAAFDSINHPLAVPPESPLSVVFECEDVSRMSLSRLRELIQDEEMGAEPETRAYLLGVYDMRAAFEAAAPAKLRDQITQRQYFTP